ncbi:MAG: hypothetical protein EOP19_10635 [Hyphomicrobiales bacterium]|nr:hypothetical protein [Caulobacter sp.]RYE84857.1 MAG: hypothetical protein EOP19_10635 [Hyphomicrobiales bacterium]
MADRTKQDDKKQTKSGAPKVARREFLTAATVLAGSALVVDEAMAQAAPVAGRASDAKLRAASAEFISTGNVSDLRSVRLPGVDKPFEQMTISELTQLRPGSEAANSYNIEAVSSDVTVSTSSMLANIARLRGVKGVQAEVARVAPKARLKIEGL